MSVEVLAPKVPCPKCAMLTRRAGGYCGKHRWLEPGLLPRRRVPKAGWLHEANLKVLQGLDYSGCPERIRKEVHDYLTQGIAPGLGVRGILENDLRGSFGEWRGRGEELLAFQQWLYNECPAFALGNKDQVGLFLASWKEER